MNARPTVDPEKSVDLQGRKERITNKETVLFFFFINSLFRTLNKYWRDLNCQPLLKYLGWGLKS